MKRYNPTTPGRRGMTSPDYSALTTDTPYKPLTKGSKRTSARNSHGRITKRWRGGGHKRKYRKIDFKRIDKRGIPAIVETVEYDPNRTAFISLIRYDDGERRYIIAPEGISVGQEIITDEKAPLKTGNRMMLKNMPIGYKVYNIELNPGGGGILVRSAGSSAEILGANAGFTELKLASTEVRRVQWNCYGTIGEISNSEHGLITIGKAGRSRWMGRRPKVRASAMNPVDHLYGGGEGRTQRGTRRPKDKWGNITGGRKTRNKKKASSKHIVQGRKKRKR